MDGDALERFYAEQEREERGEDEEDSDVEQEEEEEEEDNSKRKAPSGTPTDPPSKKPKTTTLNDPTKYFMRLKCRETGEGEICPITEKGTITFGGPDLTSFTGVVNMPFIGPKVIFEARKVSGAPEYSSKEWGDYSWGVYGRGCVRRWR